MGSETRVLYRGLESGRYFFRVMARNSYGDWVFKGDSFSFFIELPFYQSFWFYFLLAALLAVGLVGVPRWRQRYLRKVLQDESVEGGKKYKSSSLSRPQAQGYLEDLLNLMDSEKPYLDPKLSAQVLAERLNISKEYLSQVVNEQLDLNFKNFLNKYRVEEAKRKLADPKENDFVLMKIAFDAGFNSKSVFNDSFKKFTGMSPSQYRKIVQKEVSKKIAKEG